MTQGDKLTGIKTTYQGVKMRSVLESKVAFLLDKLELKWEYEPQNFLLSNGISYKPDFYLPELKTWVEVKGDILAHNLKISQIFCEDNNTELLLISNNEAFYFENGFEHISMDKNVFLGRCSNCLSFFFCSNLGSYHCRKCNYHNGDRDVRMSIQGDFITGIESTINFYDIESIKKELEKYGAKD